MTLKQRGKMLPKRFLVCIGRRCSTVLSTRACRLAPSKARNRRSNRSRRTHFLKYPMRNRHGSRLAFPVHITARVTGASSGPCANSSMRLSCLTRSPVRTTESVSHSTLLISSRESGLVYGIFALLCRDALMHSRQTGKQISLACVWALGSI